LCLIALLCACEAFLRKCFPTAYFSTEILNTVWLKNRETFKTEKIGSRLSSTPITCCVKTLPVFKPDAEKKLDRFVPGWL
jgi:hypothetical protein